MKQQQKNTFVSEVAEIALVYKSKETTGSRQVIKDSAEAAALFRSCWNAGTIELLEEMKVAYLNRAGHVLGIYHLSTGGMTATLADVRLILMAALRLPACSIIACHSHPSGNLTPSKQDKILTEKLNAAAALLDIKLLDHIILTKEGFYSFVQDNLL